MRKFPRTAALCAYMLLTWKIETQLVQSRVDALIQLEKKSALDSVAGYEGFARTVKQTKFALLDFLSNGSASRKDRRGLRRPGKECHAIALLRYRQRPHSIHG